MISSHLYTPDKLALVLSLEVCQREIDELKAQSPLEPREVLKLSLERSIQAWYFTDDGRVCAAGGVAPHEEHEGIGIVWLLVDEVMLKKYLFTCNSMAYQALSTALTSLGFTVCVTTYP